MLGRFGRDAGSLIGVEISSSAVRVLQVRPGRPLSWAEEALPPGAWSDPRSAPRDEVAQALRRALSRSGAVGRRAAVALPASQVIERQLLLPTGLSEAESDARLRAELEASVPFALDDAALDYRVLGPCSENPNDVRVACSLCQQEDVEPFAEVLELAGLQPLVVAPDSAALACAPGDAGPERALAYGLALGGACGNTVNLLPWRQWRIERRARQFNGLLGMAALLAGLVVVLADSWLGREMVLRDQANAVVREQLAELEGQLQQLTVLQDRQQALRAQLDRHAGLHARQRWNEELFGQLMQVVPPGIQLTGLTVEGNLLTLSGLAQGAADIPGLLRQLEQRINLQGAALQEIMATDRGEQFRLQGRLPAFAGEVAA